MDFRELYVNLREKFNEVIYPLKDRYFGGEEGPEKEKMKKIIVIAGGILALIILFFLVKTIFFGGKKERVETPDLVQVRVKRVKTEDFTDTYSVMGTIKGTIENELRFEIDGVIQRYYQREGVRVKKGTPLMALDPKDAQTKADYARSKYTSEKSIYYSASQRLKVYEEMYKMKALSESKIQEARFETQSAEARMKAARSELQLAESNLSKAKIYAPSDGMLAEIIIKTGDYVTPQDVVAKFVTGGDTNFEVDVPEKDVNKLKTGMKVKINCDSYPNKNFEGAVSEIAPMVKERTRTTTVKIGVPNPEGLLRSGMFGRGSVLLVELKNVKVVPNDSIINLGENTTLLPVVKPDPKNPDEGTIEMRHVKTGIKTSHQTIISEGLFEGEYIVVETQGQLNDGIRVKFQEIVADKPETPGIGQ